MPEKESEKAPVQRTHPKIVQKTSKLITDKEGNTTYKISYYSEDKVVKTNSGMEVYCIEVLNKKGTITRYEVFGDIPDGEVSEYYENGKLMVIKNYLNSQRNGEYKLYYPSGELWKEGRFSNDQIIRLKTYTKNGKLILDKIFAEIISISTGDAEVFYKNGREIARWVKGTDGKIKKTGETMDGIVKYYEDKILKEEHIYDAGNLVNIKTYNKTGQLIMERVTGKGITQERMF
ncbi:MAG: hypothetical protein WCJ94_07645 [bacterium]